MRIVNLNVLLLFLVTLTEAFGQTNEAPWLIEAANLNPDSYYGVTVANGMIGLVSSPHPLTVKDIVLNGVYDTYGRGRVSNILKGFNFANMTLDIDGERAGGGNVTNLVQTLDMRQAQLTTTFDFKDKARVSYTILALRHLPYTALLLLEVEARQDLVITPANVIEAPDILRDVKNLYAEIDRPHAKIPLLTSLGQSPTGKHTLAASTSFLFDAHEEAPTLIHEDWDYNRHWLKFTKRLTAGERFSFAVVGSATSTAGFDDPHNEAERLTIFAALEGRDRLLQKHRAAWQDLWESDIAIEGADEDQQKIRFALYHLYSFARAGTAFSLSPMGLSGLGYNGHVFWDTELWMYPPLLMLQPEIARSLLEYRFERLEAARRNAKMHGFEGAMFPWESADTGAEETPVWALTGPFQHHITGCVGWAFWKYYQVTGDRDWLATRGYPVLREVADYWVSRVERDVAGQYHIRNVVGADEYAENVDDDAFTNGIAITTLRYAAEAARTLGMTPDPRWEAVADDIVIVRFEDGTTREHATYERGQIIKQADVNLLAYPLQIITDAATINKDLGYYEGVMDPKGPAMGPGVLSVLHARQGRIDKAYDLFLNSFLPNEVPPFGVLAETAGGTNPYFATGAGGMLQAVLSGFGGLDITDEGIIQLDTSLPQSWRSLTIKGVGPDRQTYTKRRR